MCEAYWLCVVAYLPCVMAHSLCVMACSLSACAHPLCLPRHQQILSEKTLKMKDREKELEHEVKTLRLQLQRRSVLKTQGMYVYACISMGIRESEYDGGLCCAIQWLLLCSIVYYVV